MIINIKHDNDVIILKLNGRLSVGSDLALRNAIQHAMNKNSSNIIFNLRDISAIDSAGIGELVSAYSTLSSKVGNIKLCHLPERIHEVLQLTKLISVFDIYESEKDAIDSVDRTNKVKKEKSS
ncbi:MAG: STAS domain-containing protein [Ignavibacteriaceae bacterium]